MRRVSAERRLKYLLPPYAYAVTLRRAAEEAGLVVEVAPPPESLPRLRRGEVDSAIVPLASLVLAGVEACPGSPTVWSEGETYTVIVVSRRWLPSLKSCREVAVTAESRTAATYLHFLVEWTSMKLELKPSRWSGAEQLLSEAPCALVIGDEALKARTRYHVVADLGELLRDVAGLTPVYAATAGLCVELAPREPSRGEVEAEARRLGVPVEVVEEALRRVKWTPNPRALREAVELIESLREGGRLPPWLKPS